MSSNKEKFWGKHLERAHAAGLSIRAYAEANQLTVASMYQWNRKLKHKALADEVGFDEVEGADSDADSDESSNVAWLDLSSLDHGVLCRIATPQPTFDPGPGSDRGDGVVCCHGRPCGKA